ncbi:MAG: hypothetical protein Q8P46_02085 [Hyphomicrobiales bacterium]|nr:hypothetical protein [Hyphomicrobiales bacterium]
MTGLAGFLESNLADPVLATRGSVPVMANFAASVAPSEAARLEGIAAHLLANEPTLSSTDVFGPGVEAGLGEGAALFIGDHREVALMRPQNAQVYEYRLSHLAADGDMLLISGSRSAAFEHYREHGLGLGAIDALTVPAAGGDERTPLATRCLSDAKAFDRIAAKASGAGGLTILPYIGRGSAWVLAGALAERSGAPVRVAGPPPRLTRRVNDKVWFSHRVTEVLGARAQPRFHSVYGPAALAACVARLAQDADRVAIKIPDSAGSAGNVCLDSDDIRPRAMPALSAYLHRVLGGIGWLGAYPLLVEVWDAPVLASPSIQIWIPTLADGPPVLEGMFEQIVAGRRAEFVGSLPASLPERWTPVIADEAFRLARLFQLLGYFGRCSFDAVIAGRDYETAILHWIECNGRWGGVSIPMTLANRLTGNWAGRGLVVVQLSRLALAARPFAQALDLVGERLYGAGRRGEGVILLSPLGIEQGTAINLAAIAGTTEGAKTLAEAAVAALKTAPRPD